MPSKQIEAVKMLYRNWVEAMTANPDMPLDEWRDMVEGWVILTAEPGAVDYVEVDAGGVLAMWAVPKACAEDRVILCLHGGGFVTGSMYTHRKLFSHLAKAIGARALILNFRRPPENVHPAQLEDSVAAYTWLLHQRIEPAHIALSGDSAGGGLCITTQLALREKSLPMPAGAMLLSPWVDMEVLGKSWETKERVEALFTRKIVVQGLANMFLGKDGDPRDPHTNPLYADLTGLPPIYIQVGGDEVLLDDSRRLAERARNAGVDVRLDIFPEQQHTFQMCAGRAPEADDAIRRLAEWIRPKIGLTDAALGAAKPFTQ